MRGILLGKNIVFFWCLIFLSLFSVVNAMDVPDFLTGDKSGILKQFENGASDANGLEVKEKKNKSYKENKGLEDFEVHFFISLPFTALYSYLTVSSLDAIVQGKYPTAFRTTNTWMILGLAIGSSAAIAFGSIGRVPDQSVQNFSYELDWNESTDSEDYMVTVNKMELLKILY